MVITERDIEMISWLSDRWGIEEVNSGNVKIEEVRGGETNRDFKVTDEDGAWFVRLPYEWQTVVDRGIEAQNMIVLKCSEGLSGILPDYRVYLFKDVNILEPHLSRRRELPDGTMVARWLEGQVLNAGLLQKDEVQEALVDTLHRFHTSRARFVNDYDPFSNEILAYKNRLICERPVFRDDVFEVVSSDDISEVEEAEQIAWDGLPWKGRREKYVSTHNDLIFGNLFLDKDGVVRLLDWEYAGFNCRGYHYDWGTFLGENLFHKQPLSIAVYDQILEKASLVYGEDFDPLRVYYGALTNVIVTFWWGLVQYFNTTKERKEYFRTYVPKRVHMIKVLQEILTCKVTCL